MSIVLKASTLSMNTWWPASGTFSTCTRWWPTNVSATCQMHISIDTVIARCVSNNKECTLQWWG